MSSAAVSRTFFVSASATLVTIIMRYPISPFLTEKPSTTALTGGVFLMWALARELIHYQWVP